MCRVRRDCRGDVALDFARDALDFVVDVRLGRRGIGLGLIGRGLSLGGLGLRLRLNLLASRDFLVERGRQGVDFFGQGLDLSRGGAFGGHGVVKGRAFTGLLETLGPFLGISGGPGGAGSRAPAGEAGKPTAAEFMRQYYLATGQNPDRSYTDKDGIDAVKDMLGLASR